MARPTLHSSCWRKGTPATVSGVMDVMSVMPMLIAPKHAKASNTPRFEFAADPLQHWRHRHAK